MKTSKIFLCAMGLAAVMTACDHHKDADLTGSWTSAAPQSVTQSVAGATSATKTLSFDFTAPDQMTMTAEYDVTVPEVTDSVTNSHSYQVTASVKGTYTLAKGEKDDYMLSFDTNTLSVSGTNAPELGPVTDDFLSSLAAFTKIEDVEVSKDATHLSFETDKPDVTYTFVKK